MLITSGQRKNMSYREKLINIINQYEPENNFFEFEQKIREDSVFSFFLENKTTYLGGISNALRDAAKRRIRFLINTDDNILEQYYKDGDLFNHNKTKKMNSTILQMNSLVNNAELYNDNDEKISGVQYVVKNFLKRS